MWFERFTAAAADSSGGEIYAPAEMFNLSSFNSCSGLAMLRLAANAGRCWLCKHAAEKTVHLFVPVKKSLKFMKSSGESDSPAWRTVCGEGKWPIALC